jgi:hypothetical protein
MVTFFDSQEDKSVIRDQIDNVPNTVAIIKRWKEDVIIDELPLKITKNYIGTSFVLGHPINSTLGTTNVRKLGRDDIQDIEYVLRVVNPNNIFKDFLRNNRFVGTANTATIYYNNYTITF